MAIIGSFDRSKHFAELNSSLETQGQGWLTSEDRKEIARDNLGVPAAADTYTIDEVNDLLDLKVDIANAVLYDNTTWIVDNLDNTKRVAFEVSGVATATTRTWTYPDASDVFVGRDMVQTLTNKTLSTATTITNAATMNIFDANFRIQDQADATKQVAFEASGITTGTTRTLTVPNISGTILLADSTQTLSNHTIDNSNTINARDDRFRIQGSADVTKQLAIEVDGFTTATTRTWTVPNVNDTFVGLTGTQTVQNKTLDNTNILNVRDDRFRIQGSADATKQLAIEVDGFTTGTTRTLTAPNFDGTIATLAGTETFTNKTLTSPTINTPTIAGGSISGVTSVLGNIKQTIYTSGSGNFSKDAKSLWVEVQVQGGGGGGGGVDGQGAGNAAAALGGGSGGFVKKLYAASALSASEPYAVGAAGTAGAAGPNNGGAGGNSTFSSGGNLLTATGGPGGTGFTATASLIVGGIAGGAATGGDVNIPGGGSGGGRWVTGSLYVESFGGSSFLGRGGLQPGGTAAGNAGTGYGAGGSGASSQGDATNFAGGAGTAGIIIVTEYLTS